MTPALKKCPAGGNRQENSRHEKIFKKSIRGRKLYSRFKKKEKKKKDMPKAQYKELLAIGKFKFKKVSAHTTQNNHQQKLQRINAEGAGKKYIPSTLSGT